MMIVGNDIHAKLRRLRDVTERHLQDFLDALEQSEPTSQKGRSARAVLK